ncbi:hypothetical protein D9T14_08770 [Propionibacterium australiense]|uniref:Transposase DDE domain-containing protein n=1 Tax=Propionibacterium australiense TaxID=119981 RepID=A0A8B3FRG9_9ACTN|nr:hypothetical protein D9T14_08770 [Propionibacterium australiense]RLP08627.1 hypothetical protein D7U36_09310 [Propionibacterium australiense]
MLRKQRKGEPARTGARLLKPIRQLIESIFDTTKDQLGLERHHAHTVEGIHVRITQRLLALTAVIWHNDKIGAPVLRSLTAYDHQPPRNRSSSRARASERHDTLSASVVAQDPADGRRPST